MPRVNSQKARKEYTCGKCGHQIVKGEEYLSFEFRFGGKHIRCKSCRPRPSELTNAKYAGVLAAMESIEDATAEASVGSDFSSVPETMRSAAEEIRGVGEEYQESRDSMEQALPSGCPTMEDMEEKVDQCNTLADELESLADDLESRWEELPEEPAEENFTAPPEVKEGEEEPTDDDGNPLPKTLEEAVEAWEEKRSELCEELCEEANGADCPF